MKKFIFLFYLLGFVILRENSVLANEYNFIKAISGGTSISPTLDIYGVAADGSTTLLNKWDQIIGENTSYVTANNLLVDEYQGKLFFNVRESGSQTWHNIYSYNIEYDLKNNTFTKADNLDLQNLEIMPKGIISMIEKKEDGSVHIGENSAVFKEENGREKFWAQDANGKAIPIDITNGSKLLINGRDVEQSINNVGALSAALTGLPTVPTDTTLACGLGTGTHGGDFAFSGGCASKVNEKLSINYAASMTMPGQDYAGDFEDTFSARAGFVWKLGKSTKPSQISINEKDELMQEISDLKANNKKIISQNKALLARLERLEKIALSTTKSKDLATIKLP